MCIFITWSIKRRQNKKCIRISFSSNYRVQIQNHTTNNDKCVYRWFDESITFFGLTHYNNNRLYFDLLIYFCVCVHCSVKKHSSTILTSNVPKFLNNAEFSIWQAVCQKQIIIQLISLLPSTESILTNTTNISCKIWTPERITFEVHLQLLLVVIIF